MAFVKNSIMFGVGGGGNITVVANYSALPDPTTVSGQFYWCESSQGTSWLPGSLGGTYYNSGMYYSNGVSWSFVNVPYQATQTEVNTGTNTDKFVTPSTFANATKWLTKKDVSAVISSNTTASNGGDYTVVANATFTDPTPVEGNGYVVFVRNGTATIGGTAYGVGTLVYRVYHSGAWSNTVYIDESKVEKIIRSKNNGTYGSHTGNTAETVIQTINISAGEFAIGDWMNLMADFTKTGTAGTATVRFRAGTNGTTSDALIASLFLNTTVLDAGFNRERFQFKTGNLLSGVANNYTAQTFDIVASTIAKQSTSLTPSSDWILTITVQLSNSGDSVACDGYVISKTKTF